MSEPFAMMEESAIKAGEALHAVAVRALDIANTQQCNCRFIFNDTPGCAKPGEDPWTVVRRWSMAWDNLQNDPGLMTLWMIALNAYRRDVAAEKDNARV